MPERKSGASSGVALDLGLNFTGWPRLVTTKTLTREPSFPSFPPEGSAVVTRYLSDRDVLVTATAESLQTNARHPRLAAWSMEIVGLSRVRTELSVEMHQRPP